MAANRADPSGFAAHNPDPSRSTQAAVRWITRRPGAFDDQADRTAKSAHYQHGD